MTEVIRPMKIHIEAALPDDVDTAQVFRVAQVLAACAARLLPDPITVAARPPDQRDFKRATMLIIRTAIEQATLLLGGVLHTLSVTEGGETPEVQAPTSGRRFH
jgi:hypothetical protein